MKKIKILSLFLCFVTIFALAGCADKQLPSAKILRDDARVGGSLSFVYDEKEHTIFVGGTDEVVQFSQANESKNLTEGCRIGLKVIAPDEVEDIENATLEMNGINYTADDFLEVINGQKQRFFNIYPLVTKENKSVKFEIKWQDKTKTQKYKLIVEDGTKFMTKTGEVE